MEIAKRVEYNKQRENSTMPRGSGLACLVQRMSTEMSYFAYAQNELKLVIAIQ